jgi:succinate dehydrogenase/fumarate reductase flavoprotein subunit
MWDHAGVIRNGEDLRRGIKTLRILHTALDTLSVSTKTRIWNKELLDFFEAIFMITVAQRIMEGALFREESRGSHQRTDHPRSDNSVWLVNIIHRKGHPLRTCRPRVSRIPLEELHEEE